MADTDAVIHLVARTHVMSETADDPEQAYRDINVAGTQAVANAAMQCGVRRIVYMSSIKVNGEATDGAAYTEDNPPAPEDAYGRTKLEAETLLIDLCGKGDLEWTILRPPLVYGAGAGGNFSALARLCARPIPLPFGGVTRNARSLIAVENLADAAISAVTHRNSAGEIYLVRDGTDLSTRELITEMRAGISRRPSLLPIPAGFLDSALRLAGKGYIAKRLMGSLQINDTKIRKQIDWQPVVDTRKAIRAATAAIIKGSSE